MTDLATRCEQAEGISYELDCAIWDAIYPGERQKRFNTLTAPGAFYHKRLWPADMDGYVQPLRAFTANIDAALTLVPEGWRLQLSDWDDETLRSLGKWQAILTPPGKRCSFDEWWPRCNHAATPALALCAASLRARAHAKDQADE